SRRHCHLCLDCSSANAVLLRAPCPRTDSMRLTVLCLLAFAVLPPASRAQDVPVSEITPLVSTIKFGVDASVPIQGTFTKWDATLKIQVHGCGVGRFRHQNLCRQCGYRKRHEERQTEGQGFLQRQGRSLHNV